MISRIIRPKLYCQSCKKEIPYDEEYVKNNLLYVTSDWTKCLCSRCTVAWKRREEIAKAYPDFGKRFDYKTVIIDELEAPQGDWVVRDKEPL